MPQPIIETVGLKKYFAGKDEAVKAVDGVDLFVEEGDIFGFLGPNGAGKTTTLRILTTLLRPDSGKAIVAGFDVASQPDKVRRRIGYVGQSGGSDRSASGREDLLLQGRLSGMSFIDAERRADELIGALDLSEFADRIINTYSGGQRRRLDVALGLMNRPSILFLDEPTTGLDPQNRANLWDQIRKLKASGTTVFLTTHYLEEADSLSDQLAIIDNGRVVAVGTSQELKKQVAGDVVTIGLADTGGSSELLELLSGHPFVREVTHDEEAIRLYVDDGAVALPEILRMVDQKGIALMTITLAVPTLDDVFLRQTGRSLRDAAASSGSS